MVIVSSSATIPFSADALLLLLQLASPSLPVGAYSYSEGIETLTNDGTISTAVALTDWLRQEIRYGTIRLEAVAMVHVYNAMEADDIGAIAHWNHWLSAIRDTEEIRVQNWQMGQTLVRLLKHLEPDLATIIDEIGLPCNFAIAFSMAAAHWNITLDAALLGYLHSWLTNLVNAGIKLIPLGQTTGQTLLLQLGPEIRNAVLAIAADPNSASTTCNWGMSLASMNHEALYSRLFRS